MDGCIQRPLKQPAQAATHPQQPPSGLTFSTSSLKIEMCSSPPGQKTSLTQETELLESLLQEVEHQVGRLQQFKASIHLTVLHTTVLLVVWNCSEFSGCSVMRCSELQRFILNALPLSKNNQHILNLLVKLLCCDYLQWFFGDQKNHKWID